MRASERDVFGWLTLGTVAWLVIVPLFLVVFFSFQREPLVEVSGFTLYHYLEIYVDPATYELIPQHAGVRSGRHPDRVRLCRAAGLAGGTDQRSRAASHVRIDSRAHGASAHDRGIGDGSGCWTPRIGVINLILRALLGMEGEGPLNVFHALRHVLRHGPSPWFLRSFSCWRRCSATWTRRTRKPA